ncbi:unnamed protein product [Protopolystoma xenopodis]|uniref:Uncharacterized protein n=1 Tax=Protopolystoma xenopodis TaxID=117903 RepID=A0A448X9I6_9PLAT|nr:unnamed protein product [Protopolystoma xenopodis]
MAPASNPFLIWSSKPHSLLVPIVWPTEIPPLLSGRVTVYNWVENAISTSTTRSCVSAQNATKNAGRCHVLAFGGRRLVLPLPSLQRRKFAESSVRVIPLDGVRWRVLCGRQTVTTRRHESVSFDSSSQLKRSNKSDYCELLLLFRAISGLPWPLHGSGVSAIMSFYHLIWLLPKECSISRDVFTRVHLTSPPNAYSHFTSDWTTICSAAFPMQMESD